MAKASLIWSPNKITVIGKITFLVVEPVDMYIHVQGQPHNRLFNFWGLVAFWLHWALNQSLGMWFFFFFDHIIHKVGHVIAHVEVTVPSPSCFPLHMDWISTSSIPTLVQVPDCRTVGQLRLCTAPCNLKRWLLRSMVRCAPCCAQHRVHNTPPGSCPLACLINSKCYK